MILKREKTNSTPFINCKKGLIEIKGKSIPEDPNAFFDPIIDWISAYAKKPARSTKININLDYVNSNSCVFLFKMLQLMQNTYNEGHKVETNWYCEEDDDTMIALAEDYKLLLELPVNIHIYE